MADGARGDGGSSRELFRTEVDGVPVMWMETGPPRTAALMFRVGRADEALPRSGITHLVEHLALFGVGRPSYACGGFVEGLRTVFHTSGTDEDICAFYGALCSSLAALPLERLDTEKRVLSTEASSRQPGFVDQLSALRFGAKGPGLLYYPQIGLPRLRADEIAAWAATWFTSGNAALWLTGKPPPELRLPLPAGERKQPPEARTIPGLIFPCYEPEVASMVGASFISARSAPTMAAAVIAAKRCEAELRHDRGLTYSVALSYDPLDAERTHVALAADALPDHAQELGDGLLDVLDRFRNEGPAASEIDEHLRTTEAALTSEAAVAPHLDGAAFAELVGKRAMTLGERLDEERSIDRESCRAVVTDAFASLLLAGFRPRGHLASEFFLHRPAEPAEVSGEVFKRRGRKNLDHIVLGPEGISLVGPDEVLTVRVSTCAAILESSEGLLTFMDESGRWIQFLPRSFHKEMSLRRSIRRIFSDELFAPLDPDRRWEIERMAERDLTRPWHVELAMLAERLGPDERVEVLAEATFATNDGVLALTDRRLIFVFVKGAVSDRQMVIDIARDDIVRIHVSLSKLRVVRRRETSVVLRDVHPPGPLDNILDRLGSAVTIRRSPPILGAVRQQWIGGLAIFAGLSRRPWLGIGVGLIGLVDLQRKGRLDDPGLARLNRWANRVTAGLCGAGVAAGIAVTVM